MEVWIFVLLLAGTNVAVEATGPFPDKEACIAYFEQNVKGKLEDGLVPVCGQKADRVMVPDRIV